MFQKKQKSEIITGLDIGSTAIRIAVGQYNPGMGVSSDIQIIGAVEVPSEGVQKGIISSIDETVSSLTHGLEQIERLVGIPIEHAWVGISGTHIISQDSKGVVAAAKPDGEITEEDVARAVDAAGMVAPPLNYEVIHVLPRSFTVDGQEGIKNPVGMTGIRLEVDTQIIYGVTAHLKNVTKAVYRTGIDIDDLVLSILAAGDVITTSRQKDLGVAVLNIGGSITTLVVYEGGDVVHTATLPLGSEHITNDLAIGLRTSIDVAERVKIQYTDCSGHHISKKDVIDLATLGADGGEEVKLSYISEIAGARVSEILERVDEELRQVQRSRLLPAGVILTGGGAKIVGLVEMTKDVLELPASVGYPVDMASISDKINDVGFSTAIGLVKWGAHMYAERGAEGRAPRFTHSGKIMKKLQDAWKSLIP